MLRKLVVALMIAALGLSGLTGCYQMGKTTGEGAQGVEKGAKDFKEGYKKGND